ncbi:MAG: FGGY-family carbohydrate kinase, partial [Bacteroidia bacterium]|nr:FGGY-family carbohydrate kinase [Bacteroidia bacterium]
VIGGGDRSPIHIQLKADVTGMPITILDVTEAGCMGVAMLAKAAFTNQQVSDIVKKWVRPVSTVEPKLQNHYQAKFEIYKNLYPALKQLKINI